MSETNQSHQCDRCGAVLSGYGADQLCAACLLESAIAGPEQSAGVRAAPEPLLAFNDYELLEEIARGGMGVVYRARQISLDRPVAIKMILGGHLANAAEMKRFRAEAETAAQLQHPNIVVIHEVGEHAGQPFFSMDLVEGRNLAQMVRDEPLPSRKAASYLKTIAEAVQYAHSRGVLHRDLKPSNILIDTNDEPRITDFGLAKKFGVPPSGGLSGEQSGTAAKPEPAEAGTPNDLTITGQVLGSPSFIPPEQAAGRKHAIGPASDVYSLGAILYHCLTARPPFVAETLPATLRMVAENEPVSPRLLNAGVPRDLETICLKCLEKDPKRRYASAQALADELDRFLRDEPIQARPIGPALRLHRWCLRNKALAATGTAVLALLLVVAIGSPIALVRIDHERQRAEDNANHANSEAAKSKQVAQFLEETLRAAGPSVARGRDATILREILEKTSERVGKEMKGQPEVQGDIWLTLGNTYRDMGDYPRAIAMFEKAVQSFGTAFHGDHPKLAVALGHWGRCLSFNDQVDIGNTNALLGLEMARKCGDVDTLCNCLFDFACSFRSWGVGSPRAVPPLREALALRKQQGNNPVAIADCMRALANSLIDSAEAESLTREALALHRQVLEPDHPSVVGDLWGLGQNLLARGKLEEAETALSESFHAFQRIYDQNHPHQAIALRLLAGTLILRGKSEEAELLVRQQVEKFPSNRGYCDVLAAVRFHQAGRVITVESLPRALQSRIDEGEFSCLWAIALLQSGDREQFRQYRRGYLDRALGQGNISNKMDVARTLLLLGEGGNDFERSCQFAEMVITNEINRGYYYNESVKALMEYRRSWFASAKDWASQIVKRNDGHMPRITEGWFVLAMACARLQQPEEAGAAFAKGDRLLNNRLTNISGDFLMAGEQWLIAQLLGREAREQISTEFLNDPNERAEILARDGQLKQAVEEIAKAIGSGLHCH